MNNNAVFLGAYPLQKDMRIRLPKQILANMTINIGTTLDVYFDPTTQEIILRVAEFDEDRRRLNEIK